MAKPTDTTISPCRTMDTRISPSSTMDEDFHRSLVEEILPRTPKRQLRASSANHTLMVRADGTVMAHGCSSLEEEGEYYLGHLGVGLEWGNAVGLTTCQLPGGCGEVVEVAAGKLHSLFLCRSGAVLSCGGGWEGALGHGSQASASVPRPLLALGEVTVQRIAAGNSHSLAVAEGGAVWSWGWGRHGQLGHGNERSQMTPCRVTALAEEEVVQVAGGATHSLVLTRGGRVFSFGRSHLGQCGHGTDASVLEPRCIAALEGMRVREVVALGDGASAIVDEGTRYTWGASAAGLEVWLPQRSE